MEKTKRKILQITFTDIHIILDISDIFVNLPITHLRLSIGGIAIS